MNKNRILFIDNLRAFSLLGVVVIHTLSFHLVNSFSAFVWNFLEFVVIAFIFCSGFVSAHYEQILNDKKNIAKWYVKRIKRLYIPFLLYFFVHFSLFILFPTIFTHFGMQKSLGFFIGSLVLFWGANTNWLPLIFIELTLVMPLVFFIQRKKILWIYIIIITTITTYLTIFAFPYKLYREVMWIPWSLVLVIGLYYAQFSTKIKIFALFLLSGIFASSLFLFIQLHRSLSFYDNKYPPTFYYLSFGIVCTILFAEVIARLTFPSIIQRVLLFVSKNSYALFFIHYIVLDFFEATIVRNNLFIEVILVSLVSIGIFMSGSYVKKKLSRFYSFSAKTTVLSE